MGSLTYSVRGALPIQLDDRVLAHLQVVVASKLRLRQSFFLSWVEDSRKGGGRSSIWMDATIQARFTYETNQRHQLNKAWLDAMMLSANSAGGLLVCEEPTQLSLASEPPFRRIAPAA